MRTSAAVIVVFVAGFGGQVVEKAKVSPRFGVDPDTQRYPQSTPKETLGSIVRAISDKRFDYLLAHLSDPVFVEQRLAQNLKAIDKEMSEAQRVSLSFDRLVKTTGDSFVEDPSKLTDLRRFLEEGEWDETGDDAVAQIKGLTARKVFMRKIGPDRWVLLDKTK